MANFITPPFNQLLKELLPQRLTTKAMAKQLESLAKKWEDGHPIPEFKAFRAWASLGVAQSFRQREPFDMEKAWASYQHRQAGLCAKGLHEMQGDNVYERIHPRTNTRAMRKVKLCRACIREANRQRRAQGYRAIMPMRPLTDEEWVAFGRAVARMGHEGIGSQFVRWIRMQANLFGRPRKREVVNHKE